MYFISRAYKKDARPFVQDEKGAVRKERGGRVSVCLVYPNEYRLGMANLGFQTVYGMLNAFDDCVCERAFLPGETLTGFAGRGEQINSLETNTPLCAFDIIAFSIPFEEDYLSIPRLFANANIPLKAVDRLYGKWPLVIAGGAAVSLNPEPLSDFIDAFLIGEGEGALRRFIDVYGNAKENCRTKETLIRELDSLEFAYVPSLYEFSYDGAGIAGVRPDKGAKLRVTASKNLSLDGFGVPVTKVHTPHTVFKGATLVEIERGCGRGCRFCAAGFLYLPPRFRNIESVKAAVKGAVAASGKVGLVGAAVSEHPGIKDAVEAGLSAGGSVTLSSLRLDTLDSGFLCLLKDAGYRTVTLAPEAGSQRMRDVINKGIDEAGVLESVRLITEAGFAKIKLYFLVGLPLEEDEDAAAIAELAIRVKKEMKKGELTLSVNPFIPKPVTPFQWHPFCDEKALTTRLALIKKRLAGKGGITLGAASVSGAFHQAYLARADRRASRFIIDSAEKGVRQAARLHNELITASVYRQRDKDEVLPWDIIGHGVKKAYLWKEYQNGLAAKLTPPCDVGRCFRCGVC